MKYPVCVKILSIVFFFAILIFANLYEHISPSYSVENDSVIVCEEKYIFTQTNWRCGQTGKRIGFIEDAPQFGKFLYLLFPHGLYEIADDEGRYFYQIKEIGSSKNYALLVRADISLNMPVEGEIMSVICNEKEFTDPTVIHELFCLLASSEYESPVGSLRMGYLKIYSSQYPGIYYQVDWYQDEDQQYFLAPFEAEYGQYVQVPNELSKIIWS